MFEEKNPMLAFLNDLEQTSLPRDYMGLSQIGHKCYRYLQYSHYWTFKSTHSARIQRLFGVGHRMEETMINDLAKVGVYVKDSQQSIVGPTGHWKGHVDGIAISEADPGQQFLVEFKTHNQKSFDSLLKDRVKKSKPVHYDQMMAYMGYLELPFCLYMAYNKNTSEYWIETVQFDDSHFNDLKRKAVEIIASDVLLPRIGNNSPAWFECKMCSAREVCFKKTPVEVTCRSCRYVDVLDEGKWECAHPDRKGQLSSSTQEHACPLYSLGAMFE